MPYIQLDNREKYVEILKNLPPIDHKGDLEFCIYYIMNHFMNKRVERYSNLHDCVYAAMHCADEFRRRRLDIREDEAREKNGDIP